MQDTQLELFIAITDTGSFSKAEQTQFISKQAMIKQINHLETELGVTLFERYKKGVRLTDEGKLFYAGAKDLLKQKNELCMSLLKVSGKNYLRIGNLQHQVLLDPVTEQFIHDYPDIEIQRIVHPNHSGEYRVEHDIQDIAESFLGDQSGAEFPYAFEPLIDMHYSVILRSSHPLAKNTTLSLNDLIQYPTVYFPFMVPKQYQNDLKTAYQDHPENLIANEDVDHQVEAVFSILDSEQIMIGANPFIKTLPGVTCIPLSEAWKRTYGIVYAHNPSVITKKYIETAKKYYRK